MENLPSGFVSGDIADMFGLPVGVANTHGISALPFRCYNKIYNDWFRPEYIINPVDDNMGDGPDAYSDYVLLRRAKRLDYFTGALPWPQRGPAVDLPLSGNAPVYSYAKDSNPAVAALTSLQGFTPTGGNYVGRGSNDYLIFDQTNKRIASSNDGATVNSNPMKFALYADLSDVNSFIINTMRQAFQLQKFYERLAS